MPALNFKPQFAEAVETGRKRQTIRAKGKRKWKVGDTLYLFTGMRTGHCRRLGTSTLLEVRQIVVKAEKREIHLEQPLYNGARYLAPLFDDEAFELVQADGFATLDDFFAFFLATHGRSINGDLLKW